MTKPQGEMKKPSKRIAQLAEEQRQKGIDPGFSPYPNMSDWLNAIIQFLDEQYDTSKTQ